MIDGESVLAIVPARSGSKGIPNKNMALVGGLSLIARAGEVLSSIPWIDRRVISTDSPLYAEEAQAHGLEFPFLRPASLSGDSAGALETIVHALESCERLDQRTYGLIILAEPTSPLREPSDIERTVSTVLTTRADSAITVSRIDSKFHPDKLFAIVEGLLKFFTPRGATVTQRQRLEPLYSRNGLCYCFRRETLLNKRTLITENTVPVLTTRPVANIDETIDLLWAEFLLNQSGKITSSGITSKGELG
jgi:CMP-N,N'-diacetyllegionaminic acid synthase